MKIDLGDKDFDSGHQTAFRTSLGVGVGTRLLVSTAPATFQEMEE